MAGGGVVRWGQQCSCCPGTNVAETLPSLGLLQQHCSLCCCCPPLQSEDEGEEYRASEEEEEEEVGGERCWGSGCEVLGAV